MVVECTFFTVVLYLGGCRLFMDFVYESVN